MIRTKLRLTAATIGLALASIVPALCSAQSLTLDASSPGLGGASPADVLTPALPPAPGPLPPPVVGISAATLGLLPGDVIDAITDAIDGGLAGSLHFSVDRASTGSGPTPTPPNMATEVGGVPFGAQAEAAGDLFAAFDPAVPPTPHTQILDGDGLPVGPTLFYGGFGAGLTELLASPGPPLNDNLQAFDWGSPGRYALGCLGISLAAGSPTLTPGTNPVLPSGAQPGDLIVACDGPVLSVLLPAGAMGLIATAPGCAPPACDDIDALTVSFLTGTYAFSLAPGSPSLAMFGLSAADVFGGPFGPLPAPPPTVASAASLGLLVTDNIDALESSLNSCPVPVAGDPDKDGFGACDVCPSVFNPGQESSDADAMGDACDPCTDTDGDGFGNPGFPANTCPTDLCPSDVSTNADTDLDDVGDECDNCPSIANADQADSDFDSTGDLCDPCPNVGGGVPVAMTGVAKAQLKYGSNGPGSGDDSAGVTNAEFTTATSFDPDGTHDVHVTLADTAASSILYTAELPALGGNWTQKDPAKLAWTYKLTGTPAIKASIKESPAASMIYKLKFSAKDVDIDGPLTPATGDVKVIVEMPAAALCFDFTLATCTNKPPKQDQCKP